MIIAGEGCQIKLCVFAREKFGSFLGRFFGDLLGDRRCETARIPSSARWAFSAKDARSKAALPAR